MILLARRPQSVACLVLLALAPARVVAQAGATAGPPLDSIAASFVDAGRTVGLVAAVARGSETLLLTGHGVANVEWGVPMPGDAMLEVGSVAKQFTAAAILQLLDAGALSLDDEITRWVPDLDTDGQRVTLRHLLDHTSGIFRFAEEPEWERNWFIPGLSRDAARPLIRLTPFRFAPGVAQAYNNAGFWLLGLVVERASGLPLEQYLATRIFAPLGMTRSSFCNSMENVPRRAHGYFLQGGTVRRAPMVSYGWVFAPGAVCSTAGDLVTWLRALHGGTVLSPASYALMTSASTLLDGTALQYGLGIKVGTDLGGNRYIGHGGTAPGFRADATWYPDAQLAVVVLMNTSAPNLSAADLGGRLARAVLPGSRGEIRYFTGDATPLVGTYRLVVGGNQPQVVIEVSATPEGLAFAMNGGRPQPLPWVGDLRFHANEHVTLTFRRAGGAGGPVTALHRDDAGNHSILRRD